MCQRFLFKLLVVRGFPAGLRAAVFAQYDRAAAVNGGPVGSDFLLWLAAGVIQGCPMSGWLFVLAMDVLIRAIIRTIGGNRRGVLRACADDLGLVIRSLTTMIDIQEPFADAEHATKMKVKPVKCKLVLLGSAEENALLDVPGWLRAFAPRWATMEVCSTAKYLGHWLGPASAPWVWKDAAGKYRQRVRDVAALGAAMVESAKEYGCVVLPVLSFLALLHPPPVDLVRFERHALTTILHMPPSTLGLAELLDLRRWGGPGVRSLRASCASFALRAAWRFRPTWTEIADRIDTTAEFALPYAAFVLGTRSRIHWTTPPMAMFLRDVWQGRHDSVPPEVARKTRQAFQDLSGNESGIDLTKKAYAWMRDAAPGACWPSLFQRRFVSLEPDSSPDLAALDDFSDQLSSELKKR